MTPHLSMVRDMLGLYTIDPNVSSIPRFVVEMSFIPKLQSIISIVGVGKRGAY